MFARAIEKIQQIIAHTELRNKFLFTAIVFFVFRLLAHVPVPGVDAVQLEAIFNSNQFLNFLNIIAGGTLANFSVVAVGISPYITASIILQLAGMVFPKLKEMQKDGESGQAKMTQITRLVSVPLAVFQSISILTLLRSQNLLSSYDPLTLAAMILALVAGAQIMMWLGELVSEFGIGNGISILLLGGIVSQFPLLFAQLLTGVTSERTLTIATFMAVFLLVIGLVVFVNEAVRKVQIQYAKRMRGGREYGGRSTHLPVRVNIAGVMPLIFAVTLLLVPSFIARFLVTTGNPGLVQFGSNLNVWFTQTSPVYMLVYFLLVFGFSFFSALLFFNTEEISEELKKSGAFIPGIRPGRPTQKYLEFVITRITLVGALFLGIIAVLPSFAQVFTGVQNLAVGGTSLLIVVSVIIETSKQVESMLVGQNYDRYS